MAEAEVTASFAVVPHAAQRYEQTRVRVSHCYARLPEFTPRANSPVFAAIGQMNAEAVEANMQVMEDDPAAEIELSGPDSNSRLFNEAWAIATVFATINAGAKHVEPELVEEINDLFLSVNSPCKSSPPLASISSQ